MSDPDSKPAFPPGAIVGFDFERMVFLRSKGFKLPDGTTLCTVEPLTEEEREIITDAFLDERQLAR